MSARAIGAVASAPGFAAAGARRAVETRLVDGTPQAGVWDLATGERRVVTGDPHGVDLSEIEPDGRHIWYFAAEADGTGRWWRVPFGGGPAAPALSGIPRAVPRGLVFGRDGLAAVCVGVADESGADRTLCFVGRPGERARRIHVARGRRGLVDISPDGRLLALAGPPDGPHAAVLVRVDGTVVAALPGDPAARLWALEFRPGRDTPELLLMAETRAEFVVGTWDPAAGLLLRPHLSFPTTASASWCPPSPRDVDRTILVQHETAGRSRLLLADLDRPGLRELPIPDGTIHDISRTPDGTLYCLWSRADTPATLLTIDPAVDAPAVQPSPPPSPTLRDLWTPAPYGSIHSLLAHPDTPAPWPTVFLVHGGPATHDRDLPDPRVDVLRDAGYAVVRTNYRGSTGYGSRWQHGFGNRVGLAQVEDLAAVRRHLLAEGLADERAIAVCGYSWGGYLTLLAMGTRPELWSAGIAVYPIADYPETFATTTPEEREVHAALFGGTPEEFPERYAEASPNTYLDGISGPLLLIAAEDDERHPAAQIGTFAEGLAVRNVPHELVWRRGSHAGAKAEERASVVALVLEFLKSAL